MHKPFLFIVLSLGLVVPGIVTAQDAREIMEIAQQKQLERWEGVDVYVVEQSTMGQTASVWFARTELEQNGQTEVVFLPRTDLQVKNQCGGQMSAEDLETFAMASEMTGNAVAGEIESGMAEAGLPPGLLSATGSDPWNTMDPRVMMGGNAKFLRAAAEAQREQQAYDPSNDAQAKLEQLSSFLDSAKLVGTEKIDGRAAFHLRADGINQVEKSDGQEYHMETINLYVDAKEYVPLKMRVDGRMVADGESQPMYIENIQSDYRKVPGSNMYESYHQAMTMAGLMTPEQEAEMADAMAQMKDFEAQMASMPPDQRKMMESMMGPQLDMMRNMADGGGFRTEVIVREITVNPDGITSMGQECGEAQAAAEQPVAKAEAVHVEPQASGGDDLTRMVQTDLTALGYDTDGISGEMNTKTIVAISKFQAENNMEVTGEVSPQLAGILSAHASGTASAPALEPAQLQAAQQACLQKKMEEAQAAQKKKRGFGRLMSGVSRIAGRSGDFDLMRKTNDVYSAAATADDLAQAAKDLGLTEDDIEACRNPQ